MRNICAIFQNHIKAASSGGVQSTQEEIADTLRSERTVCNGNTALRSTTVICS